MNELQDHSNTKTSDLSLEGLEAAMRKMREPKMSIPMNNLQIWIPVDWAVGQVREFCEGRFLREDTEGGIHLRYLGPALTRCGECE